MQSVVECAEKFWIEREDTFKSFKQFARETVHPTGGPANTFSEIRNTPLVGRLAGLASSQICPMFDLIYSSHGFSRGKVAQLDYAYMANNIY